MSSNEASSKVEADVAMSPPLSLFRREENRNGDTYESYALHSSSIYGYIFTIGSIQLTDHVS